MAERSFAEEVKKLRLGAGEEFRGEGILAITKALLELGVSYVAGYQGAPISHLMDVLADANDILEDLGIHFENSASEATAAATLAASVNYPLRGAVTFKAPVGTNVASDALANLTSGGVKGGAMIIIGEDYGEGSSIMQERSHPFAMKSQIWLLDPRPNLPTIVRMVEKGFELSEASNTPVMLEVRIRACHVYGRFTTKDNVRPSFTLKDAIEHPVRDVTRIAMPPGTYVHEKEKVEKRWPAAVKYIAENELNEFFDGEAADIGIVMQGGMYNTALRGLEVLRLADAFGKAKVPIYVLNVTYPLVDAEFVKFCTGKKAILIVEEGQPDFIEQAVNTILRRADIQTKVHGKDMLAMAGEYTGAVVRDGLKRFVAHYRRDMLPEERPVEGDNSRKAAMAAVNGEVQPRPPSFCTGCPERPIFTAMKLVERELGTHHVSCDIGCHLFSIFPPFNIGATTMGYGLGGAGASAFNVKADKRVVSIMGDGGFWHNGLASSVGNAVFNKSDNVIIVVDNGYTSATGGQDIPSSFLKNPIRSTQNSIEKAVRGVGVEWARTITQHLRPRQDARHAERGADDAGKGPEGHRRPIRMHAQQAAPRAPANARGRRARRARRARALRRRCRHVHGRSFLHSPFGLPVAHHRAPSRPAAQGPGDEGARFLRRLRVVRRGGACGEALPLLLPRLDHRESDAVGQMKARLRDAVIGFFQRRLARKAAFA